MNPFPSIARRMLPTQLQSYDSWREIFLHCFCKIHGSLLLILKWELALENQSRRTGTKQEWEARLYTRTTRGPLQMSLRTQQEHCGGFIFPSYYVPALPAKSQCILCASLSSTHLNPWNGKKKGLVQIHKCEKYQGQFFLVQPPLSVPNTKFMEIQQPHLSQSPP